jgi:hypothetical protein
LSPNPIGKVLSTFRKHRVRALLMGGQACIVYGAAEFSRDVDFAVLASEKNLEALQRALNELRAEPVYFPPLSREALLRGHACHFRAKVAGVTGFRIDIMSVMHGCDSFESLWRRRRRLRLQGAGTINVISLADLVQAKKTQRDKDWPMVRRLIEADFHDHQRRAATAQKKFWLREVRSADLLIELCRSYPRLARSLAAERPAIAQALDGSVAAIEAALRAEEDALRSADRAYWQPLRAELEAWRHARNLGQ